MGFDAIPMPDSTSSERSLQPFLEYLTRGGKHEFGASLHGHLKKAESCYGIPYIEFEKGVSYKDRRVDVHRMCAFLHQDADNQVGVLGLIT